ncbi:hypothetical protein CHS0354_040486 [Potamilus streckersoni]|uniref:CABIT domain-containing protein n=1 Tax=Potamilus streckersoni TaxID=2493646 RepID=A0AAE0TKA8_9BIVA|nr:hypothetical protein CHS0354_040486 [Potamilus streckersoni]
MATANASLDSIKWSVETYRLDEVSTHFKLPIMVRVCEGIYGSHESETFSANDVIKLEKEVNLSKVAAHFIFDLNEWRSHLGGSYDQYVSLQENSEILIPLHYKGQLHIVGEESICESVLELSRTKAKYFMVLKNLVIPQSKGSITLQAGLVIEIDRSFPVPCVKGGNKIIMCKYDLNKVPCTVELPMTIKGKFKTLNDDSAYTLQQVLDNFKLPQAVKFVDSDIQEMYCRDIVGGVENMVHFSGMLSLNRLIMQKVLIGYYKRLDTRSAEQTQFFRRPIVVLPLDSFNVKEIEVSVPQMLPEENDIYEFVMANNFLSDRTCDLSSVDGNLYAEFVKSPKVHILNEVFPPLYPKPGALCELPPPVPPRPRKLTQVSAAKRQNSTCTSDCIYDADGYLRAVKTINNATLEDYEDMSNVKPNGMGLPCEKASDNTGYENASLGSPVPVSKGKMLGMTERKPAVDSSSTLSSANEGQQDIYDYPDLSKMDLRSEKRPIAHVSPQTNTCPDLKRSDKNFRDLTVHEVGERLKLCGFEKLVDVCRNQNIDGKFLHGMEEKLLAKSPFCLTEFQIRKFCDMAHKNWIPKLT